MSTSHCLLLYWHFGVGSVGIFLWLSFSMHIHVGPVLSMRMMMETHENWNIRNNTHPVDSFFFPQIHWVLLHRLPLHGLIGKGVEKSVLCFDA